MTESCGTGDFTRENLSSNVNVAKAKGSGPSTDGVSFKPMQQEHAACSVNSHLNLFSRAPSTNICTCSNNACSSLALFNRNSQCAKVWPHQVHVAILGQRGYPFTLRCPVTVMLVYLLESTVSAFNRIKLNRTLSSHSYLHLVSQLSGSKVAR